MKNILEVCKTRVGPLLLIGLGVALVLGGLIINREQTKNPEEEIIVETSTPRHGEIVVDVSGAVEKPGVYRLPNDSRIQDALITAGGLGAKADRNYIAKYINMAQKLTDGEKIYIPSTDDQNNLKSSLTININMATLAELDGLPGIAEITAKKIVDGRPYQNISQLIEKKIISKTVFDKIKDKLSVY